MSVTLVVCAFNRPNALARLLASLDRADYPENNNTRLIISIDRAPGGLDPAVLKTAQAFRWGYGVKDIIAQPEPLGLVGHILSCGRLSQSVGDIILLEDDLVVSPMVYAYAERALDFYRDDDRIAGHCLYALWFNGYTQHPFMPLADGGDTFFINVPYTQGQAFTAAQWARLEGWLKSGDDGRAAAQLHDHFARFDAGDWFPAFARYAAATGRYTVFPRASLTTGAGDPGTHFAQASAFFETPLQWGPRPYEFRPLDDSLAVYDSFFEILPSRLNRLSGSLAAYDYGVDLHATKSPRHLTRPYVLTTRPCRRPVKTYGLRRWPVEANLIDEVDGSEISLAARDDVQWGAVAGWEAERRIHDYVRRHRRQSWGRRLIYWMLGLGSRRRAGSFSP